MSEPCKTMSRTHTPLLHGLFRIIPIDQPDSLWQAPGSMTTARDRLPCWNLRVHLLGPNLSRLPTACGFAGGVVKSQVWHLCVLGEGGQKCSEIRRCATQVCNMQHRCATQVCNMQHTNDQDCWAHAPT